MTLNDGRVLIGQLLAFDKYMNLVIADCEEFKRVKPKKKTSDTAQEQIRRSLGLLILRGETIVSCSQESGAPPSGFENKARVPAAQQMVSGMVRTMPGMSAVPPPMPPSAMMMRPGMAMPPSMMPPGYHHRQ